MSRRLWSQVAVTLMGSGPRSGLLTGWYVFVGQCQWLGVGVTVKGQTRLGDRPRMTKVKLLRRSGKTGSRNADGNNKLGWITDKET